jgi:hypothetical protein
MPMSQKRRSEETGGETIKPGKQVLAARVARETYLRNRLSVPSIAGGVLYLLGGIIVSATLRSLPTVGAIQGLAPALRGEANPTVSPGAAEVRFIDHHAFGLIAGNVLQAVAVLLLVVILLFLLGAIRFRRPETSPLARPLVLGGGAVMVLVSIVHPVAQALNAHSFTTGHNFTTDAVNRALTQSAVLEASEYLGLLGGLVLAAGIMIVVLGASRTGIFPRWMMYLGIFSALLAFTPVGLLLGSAQQLIPAFWMVSMGILLGGRWPGGDPPAWAAGEARPWPSQMEARAEREARRGGSGRAGALGPSTEQAGNGVSDVVPEPAQPARSGSSRRRRKRGTR